MKIHLVSILSTGHSGSTLLDFIVGSHSGAFSLGEISHLDQYMRENRLCTCGQPVRSCQFWAQVFATIANENSDKECAWPLVTDVRRKPEDSLLEKARHLSSIVAFALLPYRWANWSVRWIAPAVSAHAAMAHQLYDTVRRISGKKLLVDSTKSIHRFRMLHSLRPESSRAIYLTRDGRGVICSYMQRGNLSAEAATRRWHRSQRYSRLLLRSVPASISMHVQYEALCREPEATVYRICAFLNIPFEADMLSFRSQQHHNIGGNRMRFGQADTIVENTSWRDRLTDEELSIFENIAGRMNRELLGRYYDS